MIGSLNLTKDTRASALTLRKSREPKLAVDWQGRKDSLGSNFRAVFGGPKPPKFATTCPYLRDTWVRPHFPGRAFFASIIWHAALVFLPLPYWSSFLRATRIYEPLPTSRVDITYYGPIKDLPLIAPHAPARNPAPPARTSLPARPSEPVAKRGADAFHPRQTIVSAPRVPTHPRQTLIQPDSTPEPPKILPKMPNIVKWANATPPAKPHLIISREALAALRPKNPAPRAIGSVPVPELPNLERKPGEVSLASESVKPRMPSEPIVLPQVASRQSPGDAVAPNLPGLEMQPGNVSVGAGPTKPLMPAEPINVPRTGPQQSAGPGVAAPDLRPNVSGQRLIAISPSPSDAPANLPVPPGNLASRMTISPEGPQPGAPGGSRSGNASASASAPSNPGSSPNAGPPGVSISGGKPNATTAGLSGGRVLASPPVPRVESHAAPDDPEPAPARPASPPANTLERAAPGAPEQVFGDKRIYTLHVNLPNLSSVTGSWVLRFVEIKQEDEFGRPIPAPAGDLTGPVPVRKVDPRYPPALMKERVEGEVVLYAVIRKDGSVDSIQLVKGVDQDLDNNAVEAFARWKFRPAERNGRPVELEAIVHIPFRAIAPQD